MSTTSVMNIEDIQQYLPHRYPFLFVDRVEELEKGKYILAIKNVTVNEGFFSGHFPMHPVFPGVLAVEALAQASALLGLQTIEERHQEDMMCYLTGVDGYRFRRMVYPGDQLVLHSELNSIRSGMGRFKCRASVNEETVCSGIIICAYRKRGDAQ